MSDALEGYERSSFTAETSEGHAVTHDVYEKGEGPVVVVIQELPGIGQETIRLAQLLIDAGFRVAMPHLFGPLGKTSLAGNLVRVMCMRKEFSLLKANAASPIVDWLRALCRNLAERHGVTGVGTIGMCLTGNFAISLMIDDRVLAGVASQPSMPMLKQSELHMSDEDVTAVRDRLDTTGAMLAYRFDGDPICQAGKFEAIDQAFNQGQERVRLKTLPGKGHSVLTLDFVDEAGHPTREALDEVITYFSTALAS